MRPPVSECSESRYENGGQEPGNQPIRIGLPGCRQVHRFLDSGEQTVQTCFVSVRQNPDREFSVVNPGALKNAVTLLSEGGNRFSGEHDFRNVRKSLEYLTVGGNDFSRGDHNDVIPGDLRRRNVLARTIWKNPRVFRRYRVGECLGFFERFETDPRANRFPERINDEQNRSRLEIDRAALEDEIHR